MNEIYWIQRLDNVYSAFEGLLVLSIVALCVLIPGKFFANDFSEKAQTMVRRWLTASICAFLLSAAGLIFMPTTNEALTMYGVGSVIDYVQENETLQELPDKCVKALEAWADSLNEEE